MLLLEIAVVELLLTSVLRVLFLVAAISKQSNEPLAIFCYAAYRALSWYKEKVIFQKTHNG